jgi:SAM-dependent methyltransferase
VSAHVPRAAALSLRAQQGSPGVGADVGADFGAGGDDPYGRQLRAAGPGWLRLHRCSSPGGGGKRTPTGTSWGLESLRAPADSADELAIAGLPGPLLDVGCGPGRMVDAARRDGLDALGVDVSPAAAQVCRARGVRVLQGSVFDAVPGEGSWGAVLLMDGNLGIGGDPQVLVRRCAQLLAPGGVLVVEADAEELADEDGWYVGVADDGATSAPFPWARLGSGPLEALLRACGLEPVEVRRAGARCFVHARARA